MTMAALTCYGFQGKTAKDESSSRDLPEGAVGDNTAMFIPLYDANSLEHTERHYVTFGLIALNVLAFPATGLGGQSHLQANAYGLGYTPVVLSDGQPTPSFVYVTELLTYVTYSFLHADIRHLGGNMLFL